jgi:hypothetical protein
MTVRRVTSPVSDVWRYWRLPQRSTQK